MRDPLGSDRVGERLGDVLLVQDVRELLRPSFPSEDDVTHAYDQLKKMVGKGTLQHTC